MALYKYPQFLQPSDLEVFDIVFEARTLTPRSGIYRCEDCGKEITSVSGRPLPPQSHHQHTQAQGKIRWRLIVSH